VERVASKANPSNSETPSFEELAASQGVDPVIKFEALLGQPSAEDESADDFAAMLREWRQ
jgi:cyanate lyase